MLYGGDARRFVAGAGATPTRAATARARSKPDAAWRLQHDHSQMQHDHSQMQHDHSQMQHDEQPMEGAAADEHAAMMASMQGLYGPYAMGRDASGTAWQPDVSSHGGIHPHQGAWMVMTHALLNGVYAWSEGPRGDEKAFLAGMVMASARRDIGERGTLNLRAMLAPDPAMGANGYPLLMAAGETADGVEPLVDRQHPHDLFMELAASYSHRIGDASSVFVYGGLPGEPAFGPPAFMHRMSAMTGSADHASLVRLHPHHVRRVDGRRHARRLEARRLAFPRP